MFNFMIMNMRRIILEYIKIFRSIIKSISVDMVDYFFRFKKSFEMFFGNKARTENISLIGDKRMIRRIYISISTAYTNTTFPVRVFFSEHMRFAFIPRNMPFRKRMSAYSFFKMSSSRISLYVQSFVPCIMTFFKSCRDLSFFSGFSDFSIMFFGMWNTYLRKTITRMRTKFCGFMARADLKCLITRKALKVYKITDSVFRTFWSSHSDINVT